MIVRIKKWVRAALILKQGLIANKNKQTSARADLYENCIQVASKEGRISSVGQQTKIVTFNEFYYIAFTPTLTQKQTPKSLVKTMARVFFKGDPGWRKQKTKKKQLNCTALYFWKKNEQNSSPLLKELRWNEKQTKNTQKKKLKTISIGVMSEYKQVDKVIFFYINMFSVINERKEIKLWSNI